jgi:MFS family permease
LAKNRPAEHRSLADADLSELDATPGDTPLATRTLGELLCRPAILATAFAFFGYAYILYFFLSWFPSYLTMAQHLSIQKMGVVNVIPWLVGFVGLALSGFVCDLIYRRTGRALFSRKFVLVAGLAVAALCVALAGVVTDVSGVVALMATAVFFMYLTASTYWAIILDTVEPQRIGGVSGFVHMIANCAGIVAPTVTGYIVQWSGGFTGAFVLTGAIAVVGALGVAVFVRVPDAVPRKRSLSLTTG